MAVPTVNEAPLVVPEWEVLGPSAHLLGAGYPDSIVAVSEAEGSQEGEAEDSQEEVAAGAFQEGAGEVEGETVPPRYYSPAQLKEAAFPHGIFIHAVLIVTAG